MPLKPRNYRKEYDTYHGTPAQIRKRAARNKARADKGLKKGGGKEVDHIVPLSKGGGDGEGNTRVTTRRANRRKYNKRKA